jgi:hypothetical protein
MKNKKLLYVLLPAVIGIWALIFYRVFAAVKPGNDTDSVTVTNIGKDNEALISDTFQLIADYRDPFLGTLIDDKPVRSNGPVVITEAKPVIPKPYPVQAPWPSVSYSGMIRNQHSSVQLAMLQVNGQSYTVRSGEIIEGIQILKVFRDSIEVSMGKERKTFKK